MIYLLTLLMASGIAQDLDSTVPKRESYLSSYWTNGIGLVASPAHWHGEEWASAGASAAITGVLITMDEPVSEPFFTWQNAIGTKFGEIGKVVGSVPVQLGFTGAALATGALTHSKPLQNFALDNLQAQVFTGGFTWLVKELSSRARPYTGNGAYDWKGPFYGGGNDYASFFSGHASLTFCTATMVYLHSGKKWWVGLISYGIASGVAVSRIQRQSHWASDVVLGSIIGTAVARFVYTQQEKRRHPQPILKTLP